MAETFAELVDKLSIVNVKIFSLVDRVKSETDDTQCAGYARALQQANDERAVLKRQINERFGETHSEVKL